MKIGHFDEASIADLQGKRNDQETDTQREGNNGEKPRLELINILRLCCVFLMMMAAVV